jgi:predicted permease
MNWWHRLLRRPRLEEQLEKELRFHIDEQTREFIRQGYTPEEARRKARLELGGPEQVKEACRDARGTRWLEEMWQDARYALRALRKKPGFAAVALLTLALGSGATTVMFTVIDGVLLKPFPYADPNRLVRLYEQTNWSTQWGNRWLFAYPNFVDCKRESKSLDIGAWRHVGGTLSEPGASEFVERSEISSDLFSILGVELFRGRAFRTEEDAPDAAPVAIISHGLWQRRFGGSPAAIGARIVFDEKPYTVVGITAPGFRVEDEVDVFTLLGQDTAPYMQNREAHRGITVWARLRPGESLPQARTELALIGRHLEEQYPKSNKERSFVADPLRPEVGDLRSTLWLLLGAVTLVLLIACTNVASLLLARAFSCERELAVRVALGAGRGRLVRQCLTESSVLAIGGGALGVALAAIGIRPFVALWPGSLPRAEEVHLDWHVLLFALAAALTSGLLFGLAPALRAPSRELEQILRAGARSIAGSSRRLHGAFVASEIALAVVLLASAGMLGRTLLRLSSLDPGLNIRNVLTSRAALSPATLANPAKTRVAWQEILDRIRRVPGVEAVAMVDTVPMREGNNTIGYAATAQAAQETQQPLVLATSVTPDYLKVMGIALLAGRFFDGQDRQGNESVAAIDEVMARQAFGAADPIGKHLWIGIGPDPVRVVGVVRHVRQFGLAGDDSSKVRAQLYYPFAQVPDPLVRRWSELMSIAVRTSVPPLNVIESLRREVRGTGNDQVLYEVNTMEQLVRDSLARQRFLLLLFGIFAALALLLACIGIYGVLAYLTGQRVPEIGVRVALGARAADVMWMVLRESLGMIFIGVILGAAGAFAAGRVLLRLVQGAQPTEFSTFAMTIAVLVAAALVATFVPARRASRIDPLSALRQE